MRYQAFLLLHSLFCDWALQTAADKVNMTDCTVTAADDGRVVAYGVVNGSDQKTCAKIPFSIFNTTGPGDGANGNNPCYWQNKKTQTEIVEKEYMNAPYL